MNVMNSSYEQFEIAHPNAWYKISRVGMWVCNIAATFYLFIFQTIICMLCALGSLLFMAYKREAYVEFEYKFHAGEIIIVKINDRRRRKRVAKFDIRQIEAMFPETESYWSKYSHYTVLGKDCFTDKTKKVYNILYTKGPDRILLRFTPDETFLDLCRKANPNAVNME